MDEKLKEKYSILADLIFPDVTETIEDLEKKYPRRDLKEGAYVHVLHLLLLDFYIWEHFLLL